MKKVLSTIILGLCATWGVQAQIAGGNWYNGWLVYSANLQNNGNILMNGMAEGEEHEFMLVPVAGKKMPIASLTALTAMSMSFMRLRTSGI